MKAGQPTKYTKELAELICKRITNGESLKKITKDKKMPCRSTINNWLMEDDKKDFLDKYEKAVNVRTDNLFDDIEEIAENDGEVQRDRLRVDTRKWYLSKVMPKKYGDKLDMTSDGQPLQVIVPQTVSDAFNLKDNAINTKTRRSDKE